MDSILTDPVTDRAFNNFLMNEFSEEKLNFWRDCNNFCVVPNGERLGIAMSIWERYLSHDSQMKIAIDSTTLKEIAAAIDKSKSDGSTLNSGLFHFSQEKIFQQLKFEYMPRFLLSDYFSGLQNSKHEVAFDVVEEISGSEAGSERILSPDCSPGKSLKGASINGRMQLQAESANLITSDDKTSLEFKREILLNVAMVQYFESFMNFKHSQNLVDFWLEVEDFRTHNNIDYQRRRFKIIMERYVQDNSERVVCPKHSLQIPLPDEIKKSLEALGHEVLIKIPKNFDLVFEEAQDFVCKKMNTEFYSDFVKSTYYPRENKSWHSAGKEHHIKSITKLESFSQERHLAETKDKFMRITTLNNFDECLKKPAVLRVFRNYTRSTFCDENLRFYFDVDKMQNHEDLSDADREDRINELIEMYIADAAPFLVNLPSETHEKLIRASNIHEKTAGIQQAKEEIHHLIDADSFKRFLKSNLYKEHLRMESEKLKAKFFKVA